MGLIGFLGSRPWANWSFCFLGLWLSLNSKSHLGLLHFAQWIGTSLARHFGHLFFPRSTLSLNIGVFWFYFCASSPFAGLFFYFEAYFFNTTGFLIALELAFKNMTTSFDLSETMKMKKANLKIFNI